MTASSSHLAGKEGEEKKKGFTGTAVPDSQINFKKHWNTGRRPGGEAAASLQSLNLDFLMLLHSV